MANFAPAIEATLRSEGGYFLNPTTGECVNRGLTHWFLRGIGLLPPRAQSQASDAEQAFVKSLTLEETEDIYRHHFWDILELDKVNDQGVASKVLDLAINTGLRQSVMFTQRAVNDLTAIDPLVVDGAMGPHTLGRINALNGPQLLGKIREEAAAFYQRLAQSKPELAGNLNGWLARLNA